jgi:PAS domain S-box-containing protein
MAPQSQSPASFGQSHGHAAGEAGASAHTAVGLEWALEAYARSTEVLLKAGAVTDMAEHVCQEIVRHDRYALAVVGLLDRASGQVNVLRSAGSAKGYAQSLALSVHDTVPAGQGPTGVAMRSGQVQVVQDTRTDPSYGPWRARAHQYNLRSSITIPILHESDVSGVLLVYAVQPSAFSDLAINLFIDLARKIGISIDISQKNETILKQLEEKSGYYRQVENIMSSTSERFLIADINGIIINANNAYCKYLGYEKSELIGISVSSLSESFEKDEILKDIRHIKKFGSLSFTTFHRHKNGTHVPFRVNATYDDSLEERIFAFFHNMTDIATVERELEDLRKSHREQERQVSETRQLLASVSEETLRQIGRDLHDDIGQILTGGAMLAAGLSRTIAACCVDGVGNEAQVLTDMLNQATHRLRTITHGLYPVAIDAAGLFGSIQTLVSGMQSLTACTIDFACRGPEPELDEDTLLHIYRIVQEATTNAIKHSKGSAIAVSLRCDKARVRLTVADNGRGIVRSHRRQVRQGIGMATMKARAASIGATLSVTSPRSGGVRVNLHMPLQP